MAIEIGNGGSPPISADLGGVLRRAAVAQTRPVALTRARPATAENALTYTICRSLAAPRPAKQLGLHDNSERERTDLQRMRR
jgi:hypothetical protein